MQVLLLDDNITVCNIVRERLQTENINCILASSYEDAVKKSVVAKLDAIIVDVDLGEQKTGLDFIKLYKRDNPRVLTIIVTGSEKAYKDYKNEADAAYLKPIDMDNFIQTIRSGIPHLEVDELSNKDYILIVELVNKVVEHTNITATTQELLSESFEELVNAINRIEEKHNQTYLIMSELSQSGLVEFYTNIRKFVKIALGKIFWALIIMIAVFLLKNNILTFLGQVLR